MLQHKGTVSLETERLILRRFTLDDAQNMFNNWANDEEVARHLTWSAHESVEVTKEVIASWVESYESQTRYEWAIVVKETNMPMGSISIMDVKEETLSAEIGYCSGKAFWGKGYMPEALSAVLKFAFEEIGLNRIAAKHSTANPNSGKVMVKCKMHHEGTLRQIYKTGNGEFWDCELYSILKSEWVKNKNQK